MSRTSIRRPFRPEQRPCSQACSITSSKEKTMALVQTTRFGSLEAVEVEEGSLLHFPEGLPGFEELVDFALIEDPRYWPFTWLQPLTEPAIAFVLMDPGVFISGYSPDLKSEKLDSIDLQADD